MPLTPAERQAEEIAARLTHEQLRAILDEWLGQSEPGREFFMGMRAWLDYEKTELAREFIAAFVVALHEHVDMPPRFNEPWIEWQKAGGFIVLVESELSFADLIRRVRERGRN
jgi:hypothetical protein